MQYQKRDVINAIRKQVEEAIQKERISLKESSQIKKFLEDGLEGYTYLE
jgi:arginine decarboxylase-like protein